ncbi:hypothetical protein H257_08554 [Aphanomyces astaci]|uniref:Uncharacterized protein n=1 Tax=Aphanomyces astaci TaxID=112090 RepID=W4GFD4_APHAT|nr:hypothetical protein H257_08554 [Aphanomyces astaci]ETV77663.1 hypothetical protein H257_08554 [Aphanomyces astaci]|eukprot:XP_009832773.1 hypothetical protein H257_08554 [Aphanomyces astaci]
MLMACQHDNGPVKSTLEHHHLWNIPLNHHHLHEQVVMDLIEYLPRPPTAHHSSSPETGDFDLNTTGSSLDDSLQIQQQQLPSLQSVSTKNVQQIPGQCLQHASRTVVTYCGYCKAHGGFDAEKCEKSAQSHGLCKALGGGARYTFSDYDKSSQGKGVCRKHGGPLTLSEATCVRSMAGRDYAWMSSAD